MSVYIYFHLLDLGDENCTEIVPIATSSKVNGMKTRRADVKKKVVTKKIGIKPPETKTLKAKKDDKKKKPPLKKTRISAVGNVYKLNTTDPGIVHTDTKMDDANTPIVMASVGIVSKPGANTVVVQAAASVSSKNSDTSTISTGSIELRLSEMISPIKIVANSSTDHQSGNILIFSFRFLNEMHFECSFLNFIRLI